MGFGWLVGLVPSRLGLVRFRFEGGFEIGLDGWVGGWCQDEVCGWIIEWLDWLGKV